MATQTQTIHRQVINPTRTHDYLYDQHHVTSSERDHARATFKAHTGVDRVKRVPIYTTMFSELRHHPRFQIRLDVTDPVPKFINRQWRGYGDQAREAIIRYTTFNYDPSVQVPAQSFQDAKVSGQNRYKYFRRPIIPFLQTVPPDVLLSTARQDPLADELQGERAPTPLTRVAMTQTDYRDSEAQTDPYTPEYVVRPGSQPELLTLATLSYGRGLPAGLAEVEMIERARTKRAWEASLPPLSDMTQLDRRRKMMDDMETQEWALREKEIERLQEARLEVLKKLLKQREENHQDLNTKRLDRIWSVKQEMKDSRVKKIRNEHIKTIRKLTEKRRVVEGKLERRDITSEYANFNSQTYAPMTRIGVFLDRGSEQYVVKNRHLTTYHGLLELEASLPDFVTQPRIRAPKPKTVTKSGFVKRKYRNERELQEVHEQILEKKFYGEEPPKPLRFLQKIEKPIPRPPTPAVEVPSEDEENRELATIFLQQVIRGRAIQNMMFEGKEKRMELIKELRSTHALQEAEQHMNKQDKQTTLAMQRQRRLHEHKESHIDEVMAQLEGDSVGDMLDFLSKELIRLQEERRIHAFSMLAERQRRIREAEESGRRQVEERRRREEDEVFKQTVKVHQNTVDNYLESVILDSVDLTADSQARQEIRELANKINDIAYDMEENRTVLESEEISSELVHSFLLPEVHKITAREKVKRQQRKYLTAAHREVYKEGEGIIAQYPRATPAPERTPTMSSMTSSLPGGPERSMTLTSVPGGPERTLTLTPPRESPEVAPQEEENLPKTAPPATQVTSTPPAETQVVSPPPPAQQVASPPPQVISSKPPTPKSSKPSSPTGKSSPKPSSRPTSARSRPGSAGSQRSTKSRTTPIKQPSMDDLVIEGKSSPATSKPGSRKGSASSVKE